MFRDVEAERTPRRKSTTPQETMALLSDAGRWPDWYPGMTEIEQQRRLTAPTTRDCERPSGPAH